MTCSSCGEELFEDYYVIMQEVTGNELVEKRVCDLCFQVEFGWGGTA